MAWLRTAAATLLIVSSLAAIGGASAQNADYPSKPIRIIVSAAPGGVSDLLARAVAQNLGQAWNIQVIVENRGGASNQLAADAVIKAAPDGYTLMVTAEATLVINPWLYKDLRYDPFKDLTPITGLVAISHALIVSNGVGVNSVAELLARAKAKPGSLSFGNFGTGSTGHLNMETLQAMTGARFIPVQYKGATPGLNDLLGNHLDAMFISAGTAVSFVKDGKLKLLGFGSKQRFADYPDVPAIAETVPGFEARSWFGLVGPADMPKPIVRKLSAAIGKVFDDKEFQDRIIKPNLYTPIVSSPEDFAAFIKTDAEKWKSVIETAKVKID
jgi:tripartite-type tricarboxylate transporter receptor subunit TctC